MQKEQSKLKEINAKKSNLQINTPIDSDSLPYPQCPYPTKETKIGYNYPRPTSLD